MEGFLRRCEEAREEIERFASPLIVGHYDCDGIASTALIAKALKILKKPFDTLTLKKLGEEEIKRINAKEIIFVDFGGAMIELLEKLDAKIVIIDHHQVSENRLLQVNPHLFGINGGAELSAAGTAYFVIGGVSDELIDLALVGAVGDIQTPLQGPNRLILNMGIERGRVKCEIDIKLFGRISRPLIPFLAYSTDPFLPGLTGNENGCIAFLNALEIPLKEENEWRAYSQLSFEERRRLITALVKYLYENGADSNVMKNIVGEVYMLLQEKDILRDTSEFSTLLNACGRHSKAEVGIGLCMGDESAFKEAKKLLLNHRTALKEGIEYAIQFVEDYGKFYFLDARGVIEDGLVGIVAGMLPTSIKRDKPIIAIAFDEKGEIKVSGRATKKIVEKGVNLGNIFHSSSEGIGSGGGHHIAAGAMIEANKLNEFLKRLGKLL